MADSKVCFKHLLLEASIKFKLKASKIKKHIKSKIDSLDLVIQPPGLPEGTSICVSTDNNLVTKSIVTDIADELTADIGAYLHFTFAREK